MGSNTLLSVPIVRDKKSEYDQEMPYALLTDPIHGTERKEPGDTHKGAMN